MANNPLLLGFGCKEFSGIDLSQNNSNDYSIQFEFAATLT